MTKIIPLLVLTVALSPLTFGGCEDPSSTPAQITSPPPTFRSGDECTQVSECISKCLTPPPSCKEAYHACVQQGGTVDECSKGLTTCDCQLRVTECAAQGVTQNECVEQLVADCITQGGTKSECAEMYASCWAPSEDAQATK